jgi:hypothetical protein
VKPSTHERARQDRETSAVLVSTSIKFDVQLNGTVCRRCQTLSVESEWSVIVVPGCTTGGRIDEALLGPSRPYGRRLHYDNYPRSATPLKHARTSRKKRSDPQLQISSPTCAMLSGQ